MLVSRDQACSTPSSVTPLSAASLASSKAAKDALALAVGKAQAAVNSILTRSPLDFAWAGRNLMIDVARSNAEHGAPGYVADGSVVPGSFSNVAGSPGQPGQVPGGPANQGWWSGWKPGGYRNGAPVAPVNRRRIGGAYKPGFIGQGECVPDSPAVDTRVVRMPSNPPAPQTTIPPIDSTGLPALPAASVRCASPSGNICLDLRNGVVLASRVSADVLYQCSQKGYAGNCPSCDPGGPPINVIAAQLAAIPIIDSATLGPCPGGVGLAGLGRRGLGAAYPVINGAYPLSCMAAPGSSADASASLDNPISGWWWLILAAGAVWAVSASGKQQRRAA